MIAGTIYIWYISARNGSTLFDFKEIFTYYIIGGLIAIGNGVHWNIGNRISSGKLSDIMIVPSSAIMRCVVSDAGWHIFSNLVNTILLVVIAMIGKDYIFLPSSIAIIIFTFFAAVIGFVAQIYINLIFGMFAFWMTDAWGIFDLQANITNILSGKLIPLSVLPFTSLVSTLPFAYFYFLPIQVFMQKYSSAQTIQVLFVGLLWIFVLHILTRLVWKRGLKKFEAVGL
jgi:ABC-2 type transport system permease protein